MRQWDQDAAEKLVLCLLSFVMLVGIFIQYIDKGMKTVPLEFNSLAIVRDSFFFYSFWDALKRVLSSSSKFK